MARKPLRPGDEVGGYVVIRPLGAGGSGEVYLVRDAEGAQAALKRVDAHGDPKALERLRREVNALMAVRHAAVPRVLDAELDDEETFVVFEYIKGECLADHVARHGPLAGEELASMAERIAQALEAAHAAGVIHRDVTPSNVMMAPGGAVLIDFGLAQRDHDVRLTKEGLVSGTAGYVAPEVIDGAEPDAVADRWAWAATVAFAMTGKAPFGTGGGAIRATLRGAWKVPSAVGAEAVADALSPDAAARPGMRDVVAGLRGATRVLRDAPLARTAIVPADMDVDSDATDTFRAYAIGSYDEGHEDAYAEGEGAYDDYDVEREKDDDYLALPVAQRLAAEWVGAPRRPVLIASWAAAAAALAAIAPVLAALGVLGAALVGRTAFRREWSLGASRIKRGHRKGDSAWTTVALPWHVARAAVELVPGALVAVGIGAGTAALGWKLVSDGAVAPHTATGQLWGHAAALALGVLAGQAALWWGLWSWGSREGAYRVAEGLVPFPGIAATWVVVAVVVVLAAAVAVALGVQPWWWPLAPLPTASP